ncbi:hypothetical protein [Haloarcula salina]|uniref:Replication protein n=1 Tax=Haloarcula salina TaxID=1429914 RepID=A0AA41G440_9EURY|nr:hypothetical protein [Haloarcula salina]MBV0903928.1 hypothetical protein [Haloarcula salina]
MSGAATDAGDDVLNDEAARIVEAIERPKQLDDMSRGVEGWLPTLDLPGFGDAYDSCGDDIPHFCSDCGHTFPVGRTCKRSTCPRCAPKWVTERARNIVSRLDTVCRVKSGELGEAVYKHHVVLSPPDDWYLEADDVLERTQKVIKEIMQLMDAEGLVAYHPWAGKNDAGETVGDDRGEWKKRLFNGRSWENDVKDEVKPRGHFHLVVASPHIPGGQVTKQVWEETGWIIDRITKRGDSKKSLDDDNLEDVARAVTYVLSHTGIDTRGEGHNQAAYTKFGRLWHDHDIDVYDDVQRVADEAVASVAPQTLGIDPDSIRCKREVKEEDRVDDGIDTYEGDTDGSGDGSGDELEADGTNEVRMVACSGEVRDIGDAPEFLEDEDWRNRAPCARELIEAWLEWEEGDGWPGG